MNKKKLAIGILLIVIAPIILFRLTSCVERYLPRTKSYEKYPYEFEEAFNEQMAEYGMSIDIDSVPFMYNDNNSPYKTVPVQCEDGSEISCTYRPTSESRKALLFWIKFEQQLTGEEGETIYMEPLLEFLFQEFETPITEDKDSTYEPLKALTYNEAVQCCRDFVAGSERKTSFLVFPYKEEGYGVILERIRGEKTILALKLIVS